MAEAFDPYRKWLGIPAAEQPPNHYRLLGIGLFEDDPDVISSAADRQMAHVRSFQTGRHSELSQRVLNELSAARVCLLKAEEKAAYDRTLRARLAPPAATPTVIPVMPAVVPSFPRPVLVERAAPLPVARPLPSEPAQFEPSPDAVPEIRRRVRPPKPAWQQPAVLVTAAVTVGVLLAGAYYWTGPFAEPPTPQPVAAKKSAKPAPASRQRPVETGTPKPAENVSPASNSPPNVGKQGEQPPDKPPRGEKPQPPPSPGRPPSPENKPAENAPAAKAATRTGREGRTLDLLKLIDTKRDALSGSWKFEPGALVIADEKQARLQLPLPAPDEYRITMTIEGQPVLYEVIIGIIIGESPTMAVLDSHNRSLSTLFWLDGVLPNQSSRRGRVLADGRPNTIECEVRRSGVRVTCGDKTAIDWQGDWRRVSQSEDWQRGERRRLCIGATGAPCRITRLELTELVADHVLPDATAALSGDAINLLTLIDTQRDTQRGRWHMEGGKLVGERKSTLMIPQELPDEYALSLEVRRLEGNDTLGITLVVGSGRTTVALDGWGSTASGLHALDGREANNNETTHRGAVLREGRTNSIQCTVRNGITVTCNGQKIVDWKGDPKRLSATPGYAGERKDRLYLDVADAKYELTRLELIVPLAPTERGRSLGELTNDEQRGEPADKEKPPAKKPPPEGGSLVAAEQRVLALFGADLAQATTPVARQKVFENMYVRASAGDDDATVRYLLCRDASLLAMQRGDAAAAARAWEVAARLFDVDLWQTKAKLLEQAMRTNSASDEAWSNLLMALALADGAIADERLALAKDFIAAGQAMARKIKSRGLQNEASRRRAALRAREGRLQKYNDALAALKRQGDDAAVHLAAARYEALVRGDWPGARAHLTKAGDTELTALGALEQQAQSDPTRRLELAEAWLAAAAKADEAWRADYRQQARYWLLRATALLGELDRPRAEKLLAELADVPVPLPRLRPGLAAQLFDGGDFQNLRLERIDRQIDWHFGARSPGPGLPDNFYSIRWTGWLLPPVAGTYRLVTKTDDGVRLWIDDKQVMDFWNQAAGRKTIELELSAEPHSVQMEFFEAFPQAIAELRWALLDGGARGEQPLPAEALFHDPLAPHERVGPSASRVPNAER